MGSVADVELTPSEQQRLRGELYTLLARRRLVVLEHAAWLGATDDDTGAMSHARPEIDRLERRIAQLRQVLDPVAQDTAIGRAQGTVGFGARVTVLWDDGAEETYTIVGPAANDPRQGWISTDSPVGQGLLGRRLGERVNIATPSGTSRLVVLAVA